MIDNLDCIEFVELTTDYFEGALSPEQLIRLENHLAECDGCADFLAQMKATQETLSVLDARDLPAADLGRLLGAFRAWKIEQIERPQTATRHAFELVRADDLRFACSGELEGMYKLSPFIWREGDHLELMLRVVNYSDTPSEKIARIHRGLSLDGLSFALGEKPVIAPGADTENAYDSGGCEDPTVAFVDGRYHVYYTGWNEHLKRGELLLASGPDLEHLEKRGIALASSPEARNPKEAEIVAVHDGTWRLFFEYAHDDRSKIGIASAPAVDGPWTIGATLFEAREGWDSWHLSTGPVIGDGDVHVMFYNGATRDVQWRVGWIVFDRDFTHVLARCREPIVLPGERRFPEDTDIAFAASAIRENDDIALYYSIADRHVVRAIIRRSIDL